MRSTLAATALLLFLASPELATAQAAQVPSASIRSFSLGGAEAGMSPEQALAALLAAGFEEDQGGPDWSTTSVRTLKKDRLEIAIGHAGGERVTGLNEVRIWDGTPFDYAEDIERIEDHFGPPVSGDRICTELSYGARCAARSVEDDGWSFVASLTPEMVFIRIGNAGGEPPAR